LINTAGGLTGGDQLAWSIDAMPHSQTTLSTPAAEKLYRARSGEASVNLDITLQERAKLAWVPQETIVFDGSNFKRNSIFQLARSSKLLLCETVILGRQASGETLDCFNFEDHWKIYLEDKIIHREDLILNQYLPELLTGGAGIAGMKSITTLVYIGDDALDLTAPIRVVLQAFGPSVICGCSGLQIGSAKKLVCRFLASDHYHVKPKLSAILARLNNQHVPKSWAI
jgi:urease accessory protein